MRKIKLVTVWLGSMSGPQHFIDSAKWFGRTLAEQKIALMYGGGSVGDMGTIAHEAHAHGAHVIGVIPTGLIERERPANYGQLIFVDTVAERLRIMLEGSVEHGVPEPDAIVVKPGGTALFLFFGIHKLTYRPQVSATLPCISIFGSSRSWTRYSLSAIRFMNAARSSSMPPVFSPRVQPSPWRK